MRYCTAVVLFSILGLSAVGHAQVTTNPPTDIELSTSSVAENQLVGTVVGTFTTIDGDSGSSYSYSLIAGAGDTDNAAFDTSGSSLITTQPFDYESQNVYSIRVRATNIGGGFIDEAFTITVTDVNDPPSDIQVSSSPVAENSPPGTLAATLTATDEDWGDTIEYSIISNPDNAFSMSGSAIVVAQPLDYELAPSYVLVVSATDAAEESFAKAIVISVVDVNDPPVAEWPQLSITGGAPAGTVVGWPSPAYDADGDALSFFLVAGNVNGAFALDGATGQLSVANSEALSPRDQPSFALVIVVSDGQGSTITTVAEIDVTSTCEALNLAPAAISAQLGDDLSGAGVVAGNATGDVVFQLSGEVPAGVSFHDGVFAGRPEEAGTFPVAVEATDFLACEGDLSLSLEVSCGRAGAAQTSCGEAPSQPLAVAVGDGVTGTWSDGDAGGAFVPADTDPNAVYQPAPGFHGVVNLAFAVDAPGCGAEHALVVPLTVLDQDAQACCVQHTDCDDGDPCTIDACLSQTCSHEAVPSCGSTADQPDAGPGPGDAMASGSGGCNAGSGPGSATSAAWLVILLAAWLARGRGRRDDHQRG